MPIVFSHHYAVDWAIFI